MEADRLASVLLCERQFCFLDRQFCFSFLPNCFSFLPNCFSCLPNCFSLFQSAFFPKNVAILVKLRRNAKNGVPYQTKRQGAKQAV